MPKHGSIFNAFDPDDERCRHECVTYVGGGFGRCESCGDDTFPMEPEIVYWAGCDDFKSTGPFDSALDAWEALRLTPTAQASTGRIHAPGAYVWAREKGKGP